MNEAYGQRIESMQGKKQVLIRIIFLAEICLFVYGYGWGKHGIMNLCERRKKNSMLQQQLADERVALETLEQRIVAWNDDSFYKERYAREQLHMARKEDIVYVYQAS